MFEPGERKRIEHGSASPVEVKANNIGKPQPHTWPLFLPLFARYCEAIVISMILSL
jgi:hypothetical protein